MALEFYADEAGHAGINYLATDQPVHVAGGFLIRSEAVDGAREVIRQHFPKGEVKANALLRRANGPARVARVLRDLAAARVMPFFYLAHRRFSLVGKIVDVFLDPEHQPLVDWLPTSSFKERHAITELLYEGLDQSVLELFAAAYRVPTVESFSEVLRAVIANAKRLGDRRLTLAFEGALGAVEVITEHETYGDETGKHGTWAALNLPALMHLLRFVDTAADGRGPLAVVHDQNDEFARLFAASVSRTTVRNSSRSDFRFPDGTQFRATFRNVASFATADSKLEPMLQAADLLVSSIARVAKACAAHGPAVDDDIKELAALTTAGLLQPNEDVPWFAGAYAHTKTKGDLILAATGLVKRA